MPIYAYRCEACGFTQDVLQKMSDDPLTECPSCHQPTFKKQITAAAVGSSSGDFMGGGGAGPCGMGPCGFGPCG